MDILFTVIGAVIFMGGYCLCYFTRKETHIEIPVKKTNKFRNPLRTYDYDNYKSKGLYQPVKAKRTGINEVDTDER